MLRRPLNVASIVRLVACVALMGMWVRSYWVSDTVLVASPSKVFLLGSGLGYVGCDRMNGLPLAIVSRSWKTVSYLPDERKESYLPSFVKFNFAITPEGADIRVPYWCPVLLTGSVAAIPWIKRRCRFTLRSLFIAMTFLAVVLGMIAWLDRAWIGK